MAYTIKSGETLSGIAKANNTTVADIMAANPSITNANKIYAGASLTLPSEVAAATATTTPTTTTTTTTTPTAADISSILSSVPTYDSSTYGISATPETFSYDPSTDSSLQQYLTQGNASIMQTMADKGILNSTTTTSQIASLLAQATPEYEQAAYDRWSTEQDRALTRASFLSGLDQTAYSQAQDLQNTLYSQLSTLDDEGYADYKTQLATTQAQRTSNIQSAQSYYDQKKSELEAAIAKVNSTGFVDNETALILGVDVGTPASGISTAVTAKQSELQQLQYQIANLVAYDRQMTQAENSATALRDAYYNPRVLSTMSSPVSSTTGTTGSGTLSDAVLNARTDIMSGYYGNLTSAQQQQIDEYIYKYNGTAQNLDKVIIHLAQQFAQQNSGVSTDTNAVNPITSTTRVGSTGTSGAASSAKTGTSSTSGTGTTTSTRTPVSTSTSGSSRILRYTK